MIIYFTKNFDVYYLQTKAFIIFNTRIIKPFIFLIMQGNCQQWCTYQFREGGKLNFEFPKFDCFIQGIWFLNFSNFSPSFFNFCQQKCLLLFFYSIFLFFYFNGRFVFRFQETCQKENIQSCSKLIVWTPYFTRCVPTQWRDLLFIYLVKI